MEWTVWRGSTQYGLGVEEEVMILDPDRGWTLAPRAAEILELLPPELAAHAAPETHASVIELKSSPHATAAEAEAELRRLRTALAAALDQRGLKPAAAGLYPGPADGPSEVSESPRYRIVHASMRDLARRDPTFALHVHVAVADPEDATRLLGRLRAHVPLLLALAANSPFWRGRDSGFASMRVPIFQGFPRVGIPRLFTSYEHYVETVRGLIDPGAIPDATFLWWDIRLQPRFGTVEVRIMDAQSELASTAALAALVQAVARLELEEGFAGPSLVTSPEVLDENRFLAARDGLEARLIDPARSRLVPAREQLRALIAAARPHAASLGGETHLAALADAISVTGPGSAPRGGGPEPGAIRQRRLVGEHGIEGLAARLADLFLSVTSPAT